MMVVPVCAARVAVAASNPRAQCLRHVGSHRRGLDQLAFLGAFVGVDNPISSEVTRKVLGWEPAYSGLLEDIEHGHYFARG